ncbi:aldo/keto reductase [Leisingera sp. ANG-M6]|uniref:aldo/keto reductase n=1 Tax=Leisingera sp. ANG-M6 TaxID=1577900 RepID=UPI00057CF6BA|nr:aldo/keto reductase [Leisingera sp. ANG-M6]KIC31138.1 aldo/keto reductase [Leisingera sp. ANG-M6]
MTQSPRTPLTSPDGTPASRFAFGCMQFGGRATEAQSAEMYAACRAAGITHFDTAWVYTGGSSEQILGRLIKQERDQLLIATKAGYEGGAGAANLRAQLDESRRRLDLDMVDVFYLHRFDPHTDLRETMDCFAALKAEGVIRYAALSNFAAWQVMKAQMAGLASGVSVDLLQPMYSLVKRQAEVEILPMCADQGITAVPYSPLGGGLLTGKYASGGTGRITEDKGYGIRYSPAAMHETATALTELAAQRGTHPATLAVAWAAAHPSAPVPIISARNAEQLQPSLAALDYAMDADLYRAIEALSPRPAPATDRLEEQENDKD